MANRNNRQTTVLSGVEGFQVGDGVNWGGNGDSRPGTVLFISDSGRQLWVSPDEFKIIDDLGGYVEGTRTCEFTTIPRTREECTAWKLYQDGRWRQQAGRGSTLHHHRLYSQNPSF